MPSSRTRAGGASIAGTEPPGADRHDEPDERVAEDDGPVGVGRRDIPPEQQPAAEEAGRSAPVAVAT